MTSPAPKNIVMLCIPPAQGVDVIGPLEAFAMANSLLRESGREPGYALRVVTNATDLSLPTSSGVHLLAHGHYRQLRGKIDTLLIAGGPGARTMEDPALIAWLQRIAPRVRRLCSVCTGAFVLASAGLLRGRRATSHWMRVAALQRRFPDVKWDANPIWVQDGDLFTSAGVSAGMDLALALVEKDFGSALALNVARRMVLYLRRPGSQAQFSVALAAQAAEKRPLQELQVWIAENLPRDLSVEALARRSAMSVRNFARVFTRELGTTPARYVERVRVEAARRQLEATDRDVEAIAGRCGFSSSELLRRSFLRQLRVAPSEYRRYFRTQAAR
jgi:transcriptional regulator GlxA family with amidase domain